MTQVIGLLSKTSGRRRPERVVPWRREYASYLPAQPTADAVGATPRTLHRSRDEMGLVSVLTRVDNRGPVQRLYDPESVARVAKARHQGQPASLLVTSPVNGNGHQGVDHASLQMYSMPQPAPSQALEQLAAAIVERLQPPPPPPEPEKFMRLAEAQRILGCATEAATRRLVKKHRVLVDRDRDGLLINRKSLEAKL